MPKVARPSPLVDTRVIYCADNLDQLQELPAGCVDLVYIDPPFNSNRRYETFWGEPHEKASFDDRHASTQAYIDFMRPRCEQLRRILCRTGSFYYHCDWHAAHYVKVMLDQLFGEQNFQNEIIWKRQSAHSDARQGSRHFGRLHDTIFFYTNGDANTWNQLYEPYDEGYLNAFFSNVEPETGRRFQYGDLTAPGGASKGNPHYEFLGVTRYWRYGKQRMEQLHREGRIAFRPNGKVPRLKRYLDETKGMPVQSVWTDIRPLSNFGKEALGFPTQKPLALLRRIIEASSNPGDVILDAFCGCGTAVVAAEQLGRQWIGIDKSPTACRVMAQRLRRDCRLSQSEAAWENGRGFVVRNLPFTEEILHRMPPCEFESWAVVALGGQSKGYRGPDLGIDGRIYVPGTSHRKRAQAEFSFMTEARKAACYPVQVKQKDKAGRPEIDQFETAMLREEADKGIFVAFDYTRDALDEIARFWRKAHRVIIPLTVDDILSGDFVRKLA